MIQIQLNGQPLQIAAANLEQLLAEQGWAGRRIAVERNGAIVPRSRYPATVLEAGDALEVVVAVGGG